MRVSNLDINSRYESLEATLSNPFLSGQSALESANSLSATETELSPLAKIALSYGLSDLSYQSNQTSFSYSQKGANLYVHSSYNQLNYSIEKVSINLVFSAEFLGLSAQNFAETGGKPLSLSFNLEQSTTQAAYSHKSKTYRETRKPEEILRDLGSALSKVFSKKGDKSIWVKFDEEALNVLRSDPDTRELLDQIIVLMSILNNMKTGKGPKDQYVIFVSGKGRLVTEAEEKSQINVKNFQAQVNITINPPAEQSEKQVAASSEAIAETAPGTTTE